MADNFFDKFDDDVPEDPEANFFDQFDEEPTVKPEPPKNESLLDRLEGTFYRAGSSIADTLANYSGLDQEQHDILGIEGQRRLEGPEALLQVAGATVGAAAGVVGDTLAEGYEELAPTIVKKGVDATITAALETEVGKNGIKLAAKGGKAWAAFEKAHPQIAKSIASAVEVGALTLPGASKAIQKSGGNMLERGLKHRRNKVAASLAPKDNIAVPRSGGRSTEDWKRTRKYVPGERDIQVADEVSKVTGYNPERSATRRHQVVQESTERLHQSLDNDIIEAGNPKINKDVFMDKMFKTVDEFADSDEALMLSGESSALAQKMLFRIYDQVEKSDGSALGLLQVRRDFDNWVRDHGGKAFDPKEINGRNVAQKLIRDMINKEVNSAVPSVNVKGKLLSQHLQLEARDTLYDQMSNQGGNVLARAMEALSAGHVGPVGALSIMTTVGGAAGFTAGSVAGGAAVGATVWAAFKAWDSATRKKVLGQAIRAAGVTKADKLILIDLLQQESQSE